MNAFGALAATLGAMVAGCTSLPEPAARTLDGAVDAPHEGSLDGGGRGLCRANTERWIGDVPGSLFAPVGSVLLAPSGALVESRDGGAEEDVTYSVYLAGALSAVPEQRVLAIGPDLETCAACVVAFTGCRGASTSRRCAREYAAVAGSFRAIHMTSAAGRFWLDVGELELARILSRDGLRVTALDRADCMFVHRLTLIGIAAERPAPTCAPGVDLTCGIVASASGRRF